MKKMLLAVLSLALFSGVSFGQSVDAVKKELANFKGAAQDLNYYDYNFMFQVMDSLREEYVALHQKSPVEAVIIAPLLNQPVKIAKGAMEIKIVNYLRMETVNLYPSEKERFDAFYTALAADLAANSASSSVVPEAFKRGADTFREALHNMKADSNISHVLQNAMSAMDAYNASKTSYSKQAMAREFCQPVKTGTGKVVNPAEFIQANIGRVNWFNGVSGGGVVDQLETFAQDMLKYSK